MLFFNLIDKCNTSCNGTGRCKLVERIRRKLPGETVNDCKNTQNNCQRHEPLCRLESDSHWLMVRLYFILGPDKLRGNDELVPGNKSQDLSNTKINSRWREFQLVLSLDINKMTSGLHHLNNDSVVGSRTLITPR